MKKVLAIILTVVMLFGVVAVSTSADETATAEPKVTIVTNAGSPVDIGVETYFTVRFDNFESIKGMDVTITSNTKNVLLEVSNITGFGDIAANKDGNYTINENEIRFVDLTGSESGTIVVKVTAPAKTADITVTGTYAKSGTELFQTNLDAFGKLEVKVDIKPEEAGTPTEGTITLNNIGENKFVPQGGVYKVVDGKYTFAKKTGTNTFTTEYGDTDNYSYETFDLPAEGVGITTFGAQNDLTHSDRLRFGSYSALNKDTGVTHGTMVFEGDWLALKNYYIQRGYSVKQFVEVIYNSASEKLSGKENAYVYYNVPTGVGNETTQVNVYLFKQNNYMWKNSEGVLEYAIRLDGIQPNTTYTGVAYSINGDTVTISDNVKSVNK